MLKRFAAVLWWIGLIVGVGLSLVYFGSVYDQRECPAILQLQSEIEQSNQRSIDQYQQQHFPDQPRPNSSDEVMRLLDATAHATRDARETPEHQLKVGECKRNKPDSFGIFAGWVFALILWTLAYVIGGSFWRPPRTAALQSKP